MKTNASSTAMKVLSLFLLILGLFSRSVNITKHHILIKAADAIMLLVSADADAVQRAIG